MSMDAEDYRKLSDKIGQVNLDLTKALGEIQGTMGQLVAKLETVDVIKRDLQEVRDMARDTNASAKSAHKRIDEMNIELKPLTDANTVERVSKLESNQKWLVTTAATAGFTMIIFIVQQVLKGGF